ncbi:MAG: murein biosynthesis integral membrane protein MurJ [Gammaproteobacteria bacterium]|nr:murein biosynthesis integral membrane protein MurJ [Gammaproteobacteria bacterium]
MKLLKSTATVGSATILSRILGFVRDVVLAKMFGASGETDAFFLAFRIPNFMRRLFAEGSFSLAFVPVLSEYRARGDREALRDLIDHVTGTLAAILLVLVSVGIFAAPLVLSIFAPGWVADERPEFDLSAGMLRITFPYIMLISLTALSAGILNTFERFLIPALTPVLLNLSLIAAALLLADHLEVPVTALAWGVLAAGFAQLLLQIPALIRLGLMPRPRWGWRHCGVRRIMKLMIPTLFGSSVAQVNLLFDSIIATFLVTGSVSWLYYSDRLLEFPLGVLGIALATVILPNLSRKHAQASTAEFSATLDWALRLAVIITVPAAVGLVILSSPILITLFQYDAFQPDDVRMSAFSLIAYSVGLPAFIAVKVLAPGYYARQDTTTPVKIAIAAMVTNMGLNLLFVGLLLYRGFEGPHAGLALASSAAAYLNAILLFHGLRKRQVYTPERGWIRLWVAVIVASATMGALLLFMTHDTESWLQATVILRIKNLALSITFGVIIYVFVGMVAGLKTHDLLRGAK